MKVFLDTNVLASALATRGLCADVLREVFSSHDLLTCDEVLEELRGVLRDTFGVPEELIREVLELLLRETKIITTRKSARIHLKDETDIPILSAALAGEAEVFVTGDKEVQVLGRIESMAILSPREFWEMLRAQPNDSVEEDKPRR
jgi:putative PIN family toxin of toxin-antitoxin system